MASKAVVDDADGSFLDHFWNSDRGGNFIRDRTVHIYVVLAFKNSHRA